MKTKPKKGSTKPKGKSCASYKKSMFAGVAFVVGMFFLPGCCYRDSVLKESIKTQTDMAFNLGYVKGVNDVETAIKKNQTQQPQTQVPEVAPTTKEKKK